MAEPVEPLKSLFESGRSRGGIDFIYTLTRVEGMSFDRRDPLVGEGGALTADARLELLKLLLNLLRCAQGLSFRAAAGEGGVGDYGQIGAMARDGGYEAIAKAVEAGGDERDRLLTDLLREYHDQRRVPSDARRLYKLPGFDVLELLVDEDARVSGFRVHFSNDEYAEFRRTEDSTLPLNLMLDDEGEVVLNVGDLAALRQEWRIEGKPLYEAGLPGRYNAPGEWKPLVYPGDWDRYARWAKEASGRPEVQGALFYIFVTAHHAFEFAVRTSVELPDAVTSFGGGRLELIKLPVTEGDVIYDGTAYVENPDATLVEEAIAFVQALMNRIAFAFDAAVAWVPKYSTHHRGMTRATPSEDDLHVLDRLLAASDANRAIVDQAVDWYNRGRSSSNEFVAFLCAYISFESTATAIWNGDMDVRAHIDRPSKAERKAEAARCIEALRELEPERDPRRFIEQAYFQCVVPLSRRVKEVATAVFGPSSPAIANLFTKRDGASLASLRSQLAHGGLSLADPVARELVRGRLADIQDVAWEFLVRVALDILPTDDVPKWSKLHLFTATMDDPRATLCTSALDHLPNSDWRIRGNWIE